MEKAKFSVTKKDFTLTWFNGSGGGGQHKNKHANCARLKHDDTGIITVGQDHKERPRNQKDALRRMSNHPKFMAFCELRLKEIEDGVTLEQKVNEMMEPNNILIEVKDEQGNWINECHDTSKNNNTKPAVDSSPQ
jgi:protein subunit release factor B